MTSSSAAVDLDGLPLVEQLIVLEWRVSARAGRATELLRPKRCSMWCAWPTRVATLSRWATLMRLMAWILDESQEIEGAIDEANRARDFALERRRRRDRILRTQRYLPGALGGRAVRGGDRCRAGGTHLR